MKRRKGKAKKEESNSDSDFQPLVEEDTEKPMNQKDPEREIVQNGKKVDDCKSTLVKMTVEKAKSGRAECKRCGEKILSQEIRIGVLTEGDWGVFTRWQHLGCTVFDARVILEDISGFLELDSASQNAVRNRKAETINDVDDYLVAVEPDELVRKEWTIAVEPHADLLMPLLPYQKEGLGWMINQEKTAARGGILADEMGMGKAQPLDSLVLCPTGWRMIQDLRKGDQVIGSNGKAVQVTGTYPQGVRETYWVEFNDDCGVEVSDLHLWAIFENSKQIHPTVVTTLELHRRFTNIEKSSNLGRIPVVKPVHFNSSHPLKVDPYTLGVFLCALDSFPRSADESCLSIHFNSQDLDHYLKYLNIEGKWSYKLTNKSVELIIGEEFTSFLKNYLTPAGELLNQSKLPLELKMAEVSQRRVFIQGLLDISPHSNGTISALSDSLVCDVIEIIQSIGGLAYREQMNQFEKCSLNLELESDFIPYLSPTKLSSFKKASLNPPLRYIKRVIPLRKTEVLCISVDAPDHLYVTEKFIVTHNTIQSIALLLSNRPAAVRAPTSTTLPSSTTTAADLQDNATFLQDWDRSDADHDFKYKSRGKTLIILPTVALRQWQAEIFRFTRAGTLTVYCYHGNTRVTDDTLETLCNVDVVLTSYKIIELEYRRATAGSKIECTICGKKFYPEKLRIHRKYFCGENSKRTTAQSKTERKKSSFQGQDQIEGASSDDDEEGDREEEESGDEIDRQKKAIKKKLKEIENQNSKKGKGQVKEKEKGRGKGKDKDVDKKKESRKSNQSSTPKKKKMKLDDNESTKSQKGSSNKKITMKENGKGKASAKSPGKGKTNGKRRGNGTAKGKGKQKKVNENDSDNDSNSDCESGDESDESDQPTSRSSKKTKKNSKKRKSTALSDSESDLESESESEEEEEEEEEWVDQEVEKQILMALKADQKKMIPSVLHTISWFRVICDEAHMIKDRSTSTAKAVFNLVSLHKWCLTGTPLQNRVGELYSLVRFLRIDPHAYYFCRAKGCDCKSLHYRFTKGMCDDCEHSAMQHYCHFNKHILNPIKRCGYIGEGRRAMLTLKDEVLDKILLRRTKTTRADDIQLPPRIVNIRMESLDEQEDDFYQALYTQSQAQFNTYVNAGTVLNNYAHIFDILIRLRQVVDHPYLVLFRNQSIINSNQITQNDAEILCGICQESPTDPRQSRCQHVFCFGCITDFIQVENSDTTATCPICQVPLSIDLEQNSQTSNEGNGIKQREVTIGRKSFLRHINIQKFHSSTKLEALMQELYRMKLADFGAKGIVFSQFVNFLDILEYRIQKEGMSCVKLVGSMTVDARDKIIKSFNENPEISVLLISLKAGGVALNLTAANYIFVMDPWWNPAAEMQAIDRTHRIGQHKPIHATRFIIQNTIEERILQLQEKKKLVFDGTIGGDASSMAKLTVDDLRFLFQ